MIKTESDKAYDDKRIGFLSYVPVYKERIRVLWPTCRAIKVGLLIKFFSEYRNPTECEQNIIHRPNSTWRIYSGLKCLQLSCKYF